MIISQTIDRLGLKATLSFEVSDEAILPSVGDKTADLSALNNYDEALWEAYSNIRLSQVVQDSLAQAHQELFGSLVSLGCQILSENYPFSNKADDNSPESPENSEEKI